MHTHITFHVVSHYKKINWVMLLAGDVLSGTSASGVHHFGVLEGWFGSHWWNSRFVILLFTSVCVFTPLACFKRVGKCNLSVISCTKFELCFMRLWNMSVDVPNYKILHICCLFVFSQWKRIAYWIETRPLMFDTLIALQIHWDTLQLSQ